MDVFDRLIFVWDCYKIIEEFSNYLFIVYLYGFEVEKVKVKCD